MRIDLVTEVEASPHHRQDVFRVSPEAESDWVLSLALKLPERRHGDNKPASARQRDTLATFFWGTDPLPRGAGWQQGSLLMSLRGLAYAVAETMEEGFLADHRILMAPLIAAYMSHSPYLLSVARGWSLGTWREGSTRPHSDWLFLIAAPFYRELLEFALLARDELCSAIGDAEVG
jgi:hypothetical protein